KFNSPTSLCTSNDWTAFMKSIGALLHVNKIFEVGVSESLREHMRRFNLDIIEKAGLCISTELDHVYELVLGVIDVTRCKEKGYQTLVKDGFCAELDELRQIYEGLPEFLQEVSSMEFEHLPHLHKENLPPCIVYIQQIGYLMCIFGEKLEEIALDRIKEFEFSFSDLDGETHRFFYHTPKTRELDNVLGDIYHKILDMERAIIRDLLSHTLLFSAHLLKAVNFVAELDCILSLACVAHQNNYVRPVLTMESLLDIRNGRHVLQEMAVDTFIPNDTEINDNGRIHIITGPNYSGKSIYVKQVALIVFLSHIGSFVPADAATVGLTDRIFCAMGSKFMTAEQSTFMIDLHQVGMMLRQATSRSLCLLDEFGKGTLTEDGIGLLGGTISHFASCNEPPRVLVCTHLTELLDESCLPVSEKIRFYTMSVLRPDTESANMEEIVFLYRLIPGQTLLSYGKHFNSLHHCVPEEVVKRAAIVLDIFESNNNVDKLNLDNISFQDQAFKDAVDKFMEFDISKDDYVRPKPRQALQFPWKQKSTSQPEQMIMSDQNLVKPCSFHGNKVHSQPEQVEAVSRIVLIKLFCHCSFLGDLTKVDRERTPWLIALFHVPWYNSNDAHQNEGDGMMAEMEPLLYASGVDIVFTGHVHAYERTKRVNNGKSDPCGPVHITIGDGGNREGLARKYKDPSPEWSVFREASFGHGELQMVNSTHAHWTWHRNDDDEPTKSDEVWLTSLVNSGCWTEKKWNENLRKILMEP
ncbi:hypothetical protein Bca52824_096098, partial [Brassica carinata]